MSLGTSKQKETSQSTQVHNPWDVQAPYLQRAFNEAAAALDTAKAAGGQPSNFVAQFNPEQLAIFRKMIGFGNNNDAIAQSSAAAGATMTGAGSSATQGALSALGGFRPTGGTESNIEAASAYANNPAISGMVDAAMRDAIRSVSEQALPSLARRAAASGNLNSSKRAISEGILSRGLAERAADVSAALRGDAFKTGLNLAEQGRQFDNSAILDAMRYLGALGIGAVGTGVGANSAAIAQQGGLFDLANAGAGGLREAEQARLDNELQKYGFNTQSLFDAIDRYWNIVGSNNWGGTVNTSSVKESSKTASPLAQIGSAVGAVGSLLKSDRRVKTDIRPVGKLDNGLTVYTFRYWGSPGTHIGLMAQDVEKVNPAAVHEINGVKYVDYALAAR